MRNFFIALLALVAPGQLLANLEFTPGLPDWQAAIPGGEAGVVQQDGESVLRLSYPEPCPVGFPNVARTFPAQPGEAVQLQLEAKAEGVRHGYGVYASLEYQDAQGRRIQYTQSGGLTGDTGWEALTIDAVIPARTVTLKVALLLHGHGVGYFRRLNLTREPAAIQPAPTGPVRLEVTRQVACPSLIGFGFEDDGWFFGPDNQGQGITAEDIKLREARIRWLRPSLVRMFCWSRDWLSATPAAGKYTFDSPNMQSHTRTLDLYQQLGTQVDLTGVQWGDPELMHDEPAYARSVGELLEHLIRRKGYSCIRYYTLTNEPDNDGIDFERYVRLYQLIRQEITRRGLDVKLVGSDDAQNFTWFKRCVTRDEYFAAVDLFSSHDYQMIELAPRFLQSRLDELGRRPVKKPLIIGEYGFTDARSDFKTNPVMEEYAYALWTQDFLIEALNRGVAGCSIWVLHEMRYPKPSGADLMNFGLWNYKDRGWAVRPVYHALAGFTRNARAGNRSLVCQSSHPAYCKAAVAGETLFVLNPTTKTLEVELTGAGLESLRLMTQGDLTGDQECGKVLDKPAGNRFSLPAMSFGYGRLSGL